MPKISNEKRQKIQEQILFYLYSSFPKSLFISDISKELARDEEFIKILMLDLLKNDLVIKIAKNSKGINYIKRLRWRLSNKAHEAYSNHQKNKVNQPQLNI